MVLDGDPDKLRQAEVADREHMTLIADSFKNGIPTATVVRVTNADHYIFLSNEAEVLHALNSFLSNNP